MVRQIKVIFIVVLFFVFISPPQPAVSQNAPPVQWHKAYGFGSWDESWWAQQTSDGGYILAGLTELYGWGDVYLVKTDSSGNILWQKIYGGSDWDEAQCVRQTRDGGYIICGCTWSFGAGRHDIYVIKTDSNGNLQWQRTFGGRYNEYGYCVEQTSDGGYILVGLTDTWGAGDFDIYLVKTDSYGNLVWHYTCGGPYRDYAEGVRQTSDGGYIIAGNTESYGAGGGDMYLIKTNSLGNLIWQKTFGGTLEDDAHIAIETSDGGFVAVGHTFSSGSGGSEAYLVKTDRNGNFLWQKTYGGPGFHFARSIGLTMDGGFIIAGETGGEGWYQDIDDAYLVRTNESGDLIWQKAYSLPFCDHMEYVQQTSDGGFILSGGTVSMGAGQSDAYLVKLASEKDTFFPPEIKR